jgi:hypothetical protein
MRAHEFITEKDHEQDAKSALITIITTNHAMGISPISIKQLVKSLANKNFFVSEDWVLTAAKNIPIVDTDATDEKNVVLKDVKSGRASDKSSDTPIETDQDDSEKQVARMADRALDKRI